MHTYLTRLRDERDSLSQSSSGILETAATENRGVTDTERAAIDNMATRCVSIDEELRTFSAQYESQRAYAQLRAALDSTEGDATPERRPQTRNAEPPTPSSWGELFVTSDAFRAYDGHGSTPRVDVPGLFTRAAITSGSDYGYNSFPFVTKVAQPTETSPLLDAVGHIATNSLVVQWLNSDPVPTAAVVAEEALKPEAAIDVTPATGTLQTYAHWKGITRQALANIPMIQSVVETQLRAGIYKKLEDDINTALLGASLTGVNYPLNGDAAAQLAAIRAGVGTVQAQGFPNANTVVLNPADWAALDVAVMQGGLGGPVNQNAFWGLRPVASAAITPGRYYVGDIKTAVSVFDMGSASVFMSDSHADYFIRNTLVILSEVLALVMVTQAGALVEVTESATD